MFKKSRRRSMKERAFQLGCNLRDKLISIYPETPTEKRIFRSLIRLHRINHDIPPFQTEFGWIGRTFVSEAALKLYGNIKKDKNDR